MIAPEPRFAWEEVEGLEFGRVVRVPAAGRLGVVEEKCSALHDEESLSFEGIPMPCPACGGVV